VTVSLADLPVVSGLWIDAYVLPSDPISREMWDFLGLTRFRSTSEGPLTASGMMHPKLGHWDADEQRVATFEPGTYRFAIEASSNEGMRFGCEMPLEVVDASPVTVTLTSLPIYTDSGFHWTPTAELTYPPCPVPVATGTVSVTLVGLTGLAGGRLAAFLLPRYPPFGDITDPAGFAIDVDRDPFSRTELLRSMGEGESRAAPWPWFSPDLALVPPGTHPLFLWSSAELSPYNEYWPSWSEDGDPPADFRGCAVEVAVYAGQHSEVRVTDIPRYPPTASPPHGSVEIGVLTMPACGVL
jgi:hypothetical protein